MNQKKSVSITIDAQIWEMAKDKLNCSRSEFIEDQLKKAIGLAEDEEVILRKKIAEHQDSINVLESQLCKIRENKRKKSEKELDLSKVNEILERIAKNVGVMGENQIKNISKSTDIPVNIIADLAVEMGIDVKANYEPPKERRRK